ncbi:hypothetical protein [Amycolatopsis sp. RTGN1]|uniref:hypothetical protein n=1 Tax=Amycolatopsis ponsaeliensis TaxID=2992142 RepID=UPI00254B67E8|nr:hypothetical protein [Amycolatopsis sp. RTGN1]
MNFKRSDTGTDALVDVAVGALVVAPGALVPGAVELVGAPHAASGIVRTTASRARAVRRRNIGDLLGLRADPCAPAALSLQSSVAV